MRTDTLYVTDLDGTLLNSDSVISEKSASIITDLVGDGANITVATARTPATVELLLGDTLKRLPAIVLTGAAMWDRSRRRYLYPQFIGDDDAARALGEFRRAGVNPFIYTLRPDGILHVYHNGEMNPAARRFMDERTGLALKKFHLDDPEVAAARSVPSTVLYFAMGRPDIVYPLAESIRSKINGSVYAYLDIFNPSVALIEVFGAGISKAEAVRRLARREGLRRVVAFGDSSNDLPMLQAADVAVAVRNAVPEAKRLAHVVIGPNNADSVARFIADDFYGDELYAPSESDAAPQADEPAATDYPV